MLIRRKDGANLTGESSQLVVFRVGSELYGISISKVQEIIKAVKTSKIPQMPDYMAGVTSLRGKITLIYDMGKRLGLGERNYGEDAKIIVTNSDSAGFIVDEVKEIVQISPEDIDGVEVIPSGVYSNLVDGFFKAKDNVISIINLNNFMGCKNI